MRYVQGNEVKKRRLDGLVCNILLGFLTVALCVGVFAFLATRSHMYHVAFAKRKLELDNNTWLLQQCKSSDFYSNMKHHSTLCDDVALAESDALWLHALRDVIDETHICGEQACAVRVQLLVEWILGRGLLTLGGAMFCLFLLFTLAVQLQRSLTPAFPATYALQAPGGAGAPWYPLLAHSCVD